MSKRSLSMQRLNIPKLAKPNSPTRQYARLQFPVNGDSSIFVGVGKKHLIYGNESQLDKLSIIEKELESPHRSPRKLTIPDVVEPMLRQPTPLTTSIVKQPPTASINPQDSLTMMEQRYNSKQMLTEQPPARQPPKLEHVTTPVERLPEPRLQPESHKPRRESLRMNSLPHFPQEPAPAAFQRYNIMELRRFNPTFLSSAIQAQNKLPVLML